MFGALDSRFEGVSENTIILNSLVSDFRSPYSFPVLDQGEEGSCVSCSIYESYQYYCKQRGVKVDIEYDFLFKNRENKEVDGMSLREGFDILVNKGKIKSFCRLTSLSFIKISLPFNGPVSVALNARSDKEKFWLGNKIIGAHAVSIVGFDKDRFFLKNSWGKRYSSDGIVEISSSELAASLREAWTILT